MVRQLTHARTPLVRTKPKEKAFQHTSMDNMLYFVARQITPHAKIARISTSTNCSHSEACHCSCFVRRGEIGKSRPDGMLIKSCPVEQQAVGSSFLEQQLTLPPPSTLNVPARHGLQREQLMEVTSSQLLVFISLWRARK